jgi:hypothetical protein
MEPQVIKKPPSVHCPIAHFDLHTAARNNM